MRYPDGRPDHIEDYLVTVRKGQWFGWSDPDNRIYANLVVHDGGSKPSESDCTNGVLQTITVRLQIVPKSDILMPWAETGVWVPKQDQMIIKAVSK